MKLHLNLREQRIVVGPHGADVVDTGNIGSRQHGDDTCGRANAFQIQVLDLCVGSVGLSGEEMKQSRRLGNIVGVGGPAGDVLCRAVMRDSMAHAALETVSHEPA